MKETQDPCYALCPGDSKIETAIPCAAAKNDHGMCVRHSQMSTNGELRFRLICNDGSAYIRTVTTQDSKGWQNPHVHKPLETYIVEAGWIGYIEICDGVIQTDKFKEGDVFTTIPDVAHNIYMPSKAIIHTVKHNAVGSTEKERADWHGDSEDCKLLSERISSSLQEDWSFDTFPANKWQSQVRSYSEGYRHFDNLIWQVPAWASGLFAATVAMAWAFLSTEKDQNVLKGYVSPVSVASVIMLFFGMFTLALAYTLYRFRWHQVHMKENHHVVSPQSFLQLLVTSEAAILFIACALLTLTKFYVLVVGVVLVLAICVLTVLWEYRLRKEFEKPSTPSQGGGLAYLQRSS